MTKTGTISSLPIAGDEGSVTSTKKSAYKLVEIFDSVKGEGTQAGIPMTFVRFSKCNLDCSWCDTPYNRVAIEMDESDLYNVITSRSPKWVIFTGGEPCLQLKPSLTRSLAELDIRMAIETNGMIWTDALSMIDYINISPKIGHPIHEKFRTMRVQEVRYTICDGQTDIWNPLTGQLLRDPPRISKGVAKDLIDVDSQYITISPAMKDSRPREDQKSGEGFQSMHGDIDQQSLSRCLYLVDKYKHFNARLSVQVHKFIGAR